MWLWLLFFLLVPLWQAHGQTQSERLASIERELIFSLASCEKLGNELTAQSGRLASLQADLTALRESLPIYAQKIDDLENELRASKTLSKDLQQEIARLRDLLAKSSEHLDALSQTFERYKQAQERTVNLLERQVTGWKVGTVVASVLAVVAAVWALSK